MRVVNASWKGLWPNLKLVLYCRDGPKRRTFLIEAPSKPWFLVNEADGPNLPVFTDRYGTKFGRVETDCPTDVRIMREQYDKHFMADVPWARRVFIDEEIYLDVDLSDGLKPSSEMQSYRKLYYDIECWNKDGFPQAYKDPIVSVGAVDEDKKEFFFDMRKGESFMLKDFIQVASDYDLLIGFNSERFDQPYIDTRCKMNKIPIDWKHWQLFDFQKMYKKAMWKVKPPLEAYTLENIAQVELGETKLDLGTRTWDLYLNNMPGLKEYNLKDCDLVRRLDEKCKVTDTFIPLFEYSGNFLKETKYYSRIFDTILLRAAHRRNEVLPSKPEIAQTYDEELTGGGGYVMEPLTGLHKGCSGIDWGQMYPSIMRTWGISFENCFPDGTIITPDMDKDTLEFFDDSGIHFREGDYLIPSVLGDLMDERSKIKKLLPPSVDVFNYESIEQFNLYMKQYIIKIILNIASGYLRYPKSRVFNADAGEAVTACGRWVGGNTIEMVKEEKKTVIQFDTDGAIIQCSKEDAIDIAAYVTDVMQEVIKSQFKRKSHLSLDYDDYGDIFVLSKKRYAWRPVNPETGEKGKIQVHGVEAKRTDWCLLTKETQKQLFEMIFNSDDPKAEIKVLLDRIKEDLYAGKLVPKMIVRKTAQRPFEEYTSPPIQAKVAKEMEHEHKYFPGEKIPYICDGYVAGLLHAVHPSKFDALPAERKKFAFDYTWHFQLLPPIQRVLGVLGI